LPTGVAVDSKGNVFFTDTGNNVIRRVDAVTGIITTVVGTACCQGYGGDGGPAAEATLFAPSGLAFDSSDNLYIADTQNNVIRRVDAGTGIITTVAGKQYYAGNPYVRFDCQYSGDGSPATGAQLCQPNAVAFDAQENLYISDSQNNVIRMVSSATGKMSTFAGANTTFYNPIALAFDQAGNLFVADSFLIYKVQAETGTVSWFTGGPGFDDGLPRTLTQVLFPRGLVFDSAGNLYFSQSENYYSGVRKISLSATPTPLF
jgi:sugar lactone lactonase YvrE